MSSIMNRPFAGTWNPNAKGIIRYGPDAIVYLNGETSLPTYAADHRVLNIQPYITNVSTDCGVTAGASSASVSLSIPRQVGSALFRDGYTTISVGLEVHIYIRGYFPIKGAARSNAADDIKELQDELGDSAIDLPMRPFYPAFHGVITSVSHSVSGGIYEIGFECAGMLHFWETQTVSINGPLLGKRPRGSKTTMHYQTGHKFTNMSPFAVIYSLFRDVGGSAAGIGYTLSTGSNVDSMNIAEGEKLSMFQASQLYWERRFATEVYGLKMYGVNGALFNTAQQAMIGRMSSDNMDFHAATDWSGHMRKEYGTHRIDDFDPDQAWLYSSGEPARGPKSGAKDDQDFVARQFREAMKSSITQQNINLLGRAEENRAVAVSVPQLKAFATDYSTFGSVNLFEGTYESKLDLANQVSEACGYEFYQDVDGDLVFKPPMYNMDTRSSPVYNIRPIDIINLSFTESEPDVTYMTCKSGAFSNIKGVGLDGEWGVKGMYVDYRLIAKFGWKPGDFESSFYSSGQSAFFAAVAKLDQENKNMYAASLTIPLRPELRPGYPVYIQHIDAFYYIESLSHSFTYGGQATTTLTLNARRIKFVPPGLPSDVLKGIDAVTLDKPWNPPMPMQAVGPDGKSLRVQGFPNVVMAYDPTQQSPSALGYDRAYQDAGNLSYSSQRNGGTVTALLSKARELGLIQFNKYFDSSKTYEIKAWENAEPQIIVGMQNGEPMFAPINMTALNSQLLTMRSIKNDVDREKKETWNVNMVAKDERWETLIAKQQRNENQYEAGDAENLTLLQLFNIVEVRLPNGDNMANAVQLLDVISSKKATFMNVDQPGYYRYYSSAHPDTKHQAVGAFSQVFDEKNNVISEVSSAISAPDQSNRPLFSDVTGQARRFNIAQVNPEASSLNILDATYVEFVDPRGSLPAPRGFETLFAGAGGGKRRRDTNQGDKRLDYKDEKATLTKATHNIYKLEFGQFKWMIPTLIVADKFEPRVETKGGGWADFIDQVTKRFTSDSSAVVKQLRANRQDDGKITDIKGVQKSWPGIWRFTDASASLWDNLQPFLEYMEKVEVPRITGGTNGFGGFKFTESFTYQDQNAPTGEMKTYPSLFDQIFPVSEYDRSQGKWVPGSILPYVTESDPTARYAYKIQLIDRNNNTVDYYGSNRSVSTLPESGVKELTPRQLNPFFKKERFAQGGIKAGWYKRGYPVPAIPLYHLPVLGGPYGSAEIGYLGKESEMSSDGFEVTRVDVETVWEDLAMHIGNVIWIRIQHINSQMCLAYRRYVEQLEKMDGISSGTADEKRNYILRGSDQDEGRYKNDGYWLLRNPEEIEKRRKAEGDSKAYQGYLSEDPGSEFNPAKAMYTQIYKFCKTFGEIFDFNFSFTGVYKRADEYRNKGKKGDFSREGLGYTTKTPIFPVSDNGGYEHFGSYGYGRGMDIRPGANFEALMTTDPFSFVDRDSMDQFVAWLMHDTSDDAAAIQSMKYNAHHKKGKYKGGKQDKYLAQLGYDPSQSGYDLFKSDTANGTNDGLQASFDRMRDSLMELETTDPMAYQGVIQELNIDFSQLPKPNPNAANYATKKAEYQKKRKAMVTLQLINYMASTETKVDVANAGYQLADLQPDDGITPYGFIDGGSVIGDSFIDLAAFDPENFVNVSPTGDSQFGENSSPISTWVKDQTVLNAINWKQSQSALRGEKPKEQKAKSAEEIANEFLEDE